MSLSLPQLTARLEVCLRIGLRHSIIALMLALMPSVCLAQNSPKVTLASLASTFYERTGLHSIWQKHREAYARLTDRYHEPLSKTLFDTEIYLKLPSAGYLGRSFTVYLEPMGAPGQVNARNYGNDY